MHDLVPLNLLLTGQRAIVDQLMGAEGLVHRLQELGFCHGTEVEMVRAGSPCIVRLGGKKLCFRGAEMLNIMVRPGTAS